MTSNHYDLKKEQRILWDHQSIVNQAISNLDVLSKHYTVTARSEDLERIKLEIKTKLEDVSARWKVIIDNCKEHDCYDWHDSHKDYYICTKCGHTDWR